MFDDEIENDYSIVFNGERGRSFIDDWVNNEYGIQSELHTTIESFPDIPSDDRLSSNILIGTSLQSMILGTSLLSIPYCLKLAGIWGLILIFLIGVFTTISASILAECQYQVSCRRFKNKRIHSNFVDMCAACFSSKGKYVMEILVYLSVARNVAVIILLADLTEELLVTLPFLRYDKSILPVLWSVAVLPLLFISKVSKLAWFTFIGMILYLLSIAAMFGIFMTTAHSWRYRSIPMHWDLKAVGISSGIIINSYAVHMNLPSLEGSMKKPSSYALVSNVSFVLNICIKLAFGICGFLSYNDNTCDEITRNIDTQGLSGLSYAIKGSQIVFAYFTIPLQSHVVFELIDLKIRHHFPFFSGKDQWWTLLSRLIVITASLLVALLIPHFGIAVSLIGSVRGSLIALVLPPLFYIRLKTHSTTKIKLYFCYFTASFGLLVGSIGIYSSLYTLADN